MKLIYKRILNLTWKVGLGLIGLAAIGMFIFCVSIWYEKNYGHAYWKDHTLSTDIVVKCYQNNTVRVWNKATGQFTTPKLRWVSGVPERDSLTVFCSREGKRGYLNVKTGKIVIPASYSKAWQFSEGLGAVMWGDDRIGFIDRKNRPVIEYVIPYQKGEEYIFRDGFCVVWYMDKGKYHYAAFKSDGEMVLGWNHRLIDKPNEEGYRIVANEDGYWLYDRTFRKVLPESYDFMEFAYGKTGVYVTKNRIKQLLGFDGSVIEPFVIDETYRLKYITRDNSDGPDEYEIVLDIAVYRVGAWEGLMDARSGRRLTGPDYWSFEMISKDLIRARFGYDDEGTVLDKRGNVVKQ